MPAGVGVRKAFAELFSKSDRILSARMYLPAEVGEDFEK